jgi:hypothetical protein
MNTTVLACGKMFEGTSGELTGPTEISIEGDRITAVPLVVSQRTEISAAG